MKIIISTPEESAENALNELESQREDIEYGIDRSKLNSKELSNESCILSSEFWRKHNGDFKSGYFSKP